MERIVGRVASLDVPTHVIALEDGSSLSADAVLVATGASPRTLDVPGADLPGVFTLRSWTTREAITAALEGAGSAVVIGSSFIGMEAAASLVQRGLAVTVAGPYGRPSSARSGAGGTCDHGAAREEGHAVPAGRTVTRFVGEKRSPR